MKSNNGIDNLLRAKSEQVVDLKNNYELIQKRLKAANDFKAAHLSDMGKLDSNSDTYTRKQEQVKTLDNAILLFNNTLENTRLELLKLGIIV